MEARYKLTISNRQIYREIEINPNDEYLTIGTEVGSDIRFGRDLFFDQFRLELRKTKESWMLYGTDNVYFTTGDTRKLMTVQLEHGCNLGICYQKSESQLFSLAFMIDFDYEQKNYDRKINLGDSNRVLIGGRENCSIIIRDEYVNQDCFELSKEDDDWIVYDKKTQYGVLVNGKPIVGKQIVKDHYFISLAGYSFYLMDNCLYTSTSDAIRVKGLMESKVVNHTTDFVYPKFIRNTRVQYKIPQEEIEIQAPVSKNQGKKKSFLLSLIPSLISLCLIIFMRGLMGGGGSFIIYSAASMSMGIVVSVITYFQDKKTDKEEEAKRERDYHRYIDEKEVRIRQLRQDELKVRRLIYESIENDIKEAKQFGKRLFERSTDDKDFLEVYLGVGEIESSSPIKYTKPEFVDMSDSESLLPEQIAQKYNHIKEAPIYINLKDTCGVGIVGQHRKLSDILKNITIDLAVRHFYKEVKLVYFLDESYIKDFCWVRWLRNVDNTALGIKNIVCDEESKHLILESLYTCLSSREGEDNKQDGTGHLEEHYVVFVTDADMLSRHPISKYVRNCNRLGFTFIFLENREERIPIGCKQIVRLYDDNKGEIVSTEDGEDKKEFSYSVFDNKIMEQFATKLGAIYVDEITLEEQLTNNITMFELLNVMTAEDIDLKTRWRESVVYETMEAPIGVKVGNKIVSLNISDRGKGQGPHGLVAGTTGSGKSEILQTYILSMASLFHPYDVGFVLIDFKGGGMANQFKNLPHLIGTITNIDGREIHRSLVSIKAEVVRRQELFSTAGVNHIDEYIKLFKGGKVTIPLPHLIMIVDEFAELKQEYPGFMKELISAARIGRTLGIHLILATQKPAGVVDAQIWSNSKFKLCLKVQTKEDSNEVIKSPLAAEIVEPGRAYFQVGNNELFELIQSAYSGAPVPNVSTVNKREFAMYELNTWGKKNEVYSNRIVENQSKKENQLEAIVQHIYKFCQISNIEKLPGICLPPLERDIRTDVLDYSRNEKVGYSVPFGIYDDPEMQKQGQACLDITKENVYVVGAAQMGKTIFLQTVICSIMQKYSSEEVNIYIIDCGSMVLKMFDESNHVGGVVLATDEEKGTNLFKLLQKIIDKRKLIFSEKGIGNYTAYLESGLTDLPQIVIVIDNYAAFKEYFPDQSELIGILSREALGLGVSFIITSTNSNALSYRIQANFGRKVALNCNESSEYSNMLGHCRISPYEYPGRGLFSLDKRILEFQVAMYGQKSKEADRSKEISEFIERRNLDNGRKATRIPVVPDKLSLHEAMSSNPNLFTNPRLIPIGMNYNRVEYQYINLTNEGSLALIGNREYKMRFERLFMQALAKNIVLHNVEAYIIDDMQGSLSDEKNLGFVKQYTNELTEGLEIVYDFCEVVGRMENSQENADTPIALLIINNNDLFNQVCCDKSLGKSLATTIKKAKENNAFIIISAIENDAVSFSAAEVLKTIKEEKKGLLFMQLHGNRFYDISSRIKASPQYDTSITYCINENQVIKIKMFE